MEKKSVMVSIWCLTYNHKDYIKDALDGFLNQRTNFSYEILVHDDASTDGTTDIVKQYEKDYPNMIRGFYEEENVYSKCNTMIGTMKTILQRHARGKYVALCEGDDFWIDPHKLQIQIDYMEEHPECIMTAHNGIVYDESSGNISTMSPYNETQDISMEEALMWYHGNIPTASTIFRAEAYYGNDIFDNCCPSGDWVLQLYCLTQGKIHYFDRIMSCYRANVPGSYSMTKWSDIKKRIPIRVKQIIFLITYDKYLKGKYHDLISKKGNQTIKDLVADAANLSNEEIINIFNDIDYFHKNMTNEQHEKYREYIDKIRDVVLAYIDDDFCSQRIIDTLNNSKNVYIYGAGYYGQKVFNKLICAGVEVRGFIVSSGQNHKETLNERRIYEWHEIFNKLRDSCVVLAVNMNLQDEIKKNLCMIQNVNVVEIYGLDYN